jgi:DNA invertase Pin-like site-specific DNA recombinase
MSEKAAGYVRVSTEKQRDNDSHVRQRERLESWADHNGYEIDIYEDIAISGQSEVRDGYNELMGDVDGDELGTATEYDVVVVREMSRFGRSLQRVCQDIERLQDHGVDFVSLKEDIDMTTAQGKLMLHIIAAFNQFWADWSRERALEYVEKAKEEDLPMGRPRKIEEKEVLNDVQRWREAGLSYSEISKFLKEIHDIECDRSTVYRTCQREGIDVEA